MGHKVKQSLVNSRVDFFYYAFRNVLLVSIPLLVASGIVLSHLSSHSSATGSSSGTDNLTISISSACTLSSVVDSEHNASISAGTYKDNIGKTTIKTTCNDNNGYSIYANGYSNNKEGNNRLINTLSSSNVIETGLNTSGDISSWAMKLNNLPDDPSPTPPVIESAYDDTYGIIPSNWTKVLSLPSGSTDMSLGSSFTTTYAVYANSRQYTGTYQGQVKYLLTHPATQNSQLFMQDVVAIKNNLPNAGDSMQVVDQRDGKKYWVTKLKDGNIWMTSNLDLDIGGTNTAPLNSNNTDISIDPMFMPVVAFTQTIMYQMEFIPGIQYLPPRLLATILIIPPLNHQPGLPITMVKPSHIQRKAVIHITTLLILLVMMQDITPFKLAKMQTIPKRNVNDTLLVIITTGLRL